MQLKSFFVGIILCVLISLSSLYCSLSMGILAWPTLFVSLISYFLLSRFKTSDMKQVTLAHTIASSGSMVAGAIAYTVPGFWIAKESLGGSDNLDIISVLAVSIAGVVLGTICTMVYKRTLVDRENLPYPIGQATFLALKNTNEKKADKKLLIIPACIAGFFAIIRDWLSWIPGLIQLRAKDDAKGIPPLEFWPSMMGMGIGALLAPKIVILLFASAFGFQYIIFPIITHLKFVNGIYADADYLKQNISLGLMLGAGVGMFLKSIVLKLQNQNKNKTDLIGNLGNNKTKLAFSLFGFMVSAILLLFFSYLNIFSIIILLLALLLSTYLSARLTGESGINPMEVFGYITLILVSFIQKINLTSGFLIMICLTVACGLTGDIMNDFKSGCGFKVDEKKQSIVEFIGAIVGVVIAIFGVFYLKNQGNVDFAQSKVYTVPQAKLMAGFMKDIVVGNLNFLSLASLFFAAIISIFKINAAIIGLGIFLPFYITLSIALGCLLNSLVPKKYKEHTPLIASGLLTGEGVVAMVISFLQIIVSVG